MTNEAEERDRKQRETDISNLRFYAKMAGQYYWGTHQIHIHHSVVEKTLNEIADRLVARAASPVSAPTVADTWDKATRLAEQFADASESGVGRTVGLAIAAECRRRSNAVAPVSAKCEMCGSEDRAIRLCEIPWAGGQAHEPIEGEDCILCSSDWHAAAPSVASENSATQPSKSPDYEVCTNQNGHPKWCKCGSEDWMRKAAEDLAAELRRRCNTKMSLLHQSAWYEAANELEKFAETIIAKHYAASHLSTEKKI